MSDVVVFGLDRETVPLDDIQMDVPHARAVTIPADKALRSKDLWRALSQKRLFQLGVQAIPTFMPPMPPLPVPPTPIQEDVLQERNAELERLLTLAEQANLKLVSDNERLSEECDKQRAWIMVLEERVRQYEEKESEQGKIDEILRLLQSPQPLVISSPSIRAVPAPNGHALVEMEAPTFVPSEIRPRDIETRVEVSAETLQGGSLADATSALRRLRQGQ